MNFGFSSAGFIVVLSLIAGLFLAALAFFRWRHWL
jgi:hypothetical protein